MVGVIARRGPHVVCVTAADMETAEHIVLELFAGIGIEVEGEEMTLLVFDPAEPGGVIIDTSEDPMEGWTADGFTG